MDKQYDITLHIGLHKTATTTLQKQVFPTCENLCFLAGNSDIEKFIHSATTQDPIYFDPVYHHKKVSKQLNNQTPNLISKEALSGATLAGLGKRNLDHRSAILQNVQATIPEARIILVLRRQDTFAISLYRQYLKNGGTESISDFYGLTQNKQPIVSSDRFRFWAYVEKIKSMFPAGVLVMPFEEFVTDRQAFLNNLANFLRTTIPDMLIESSNETRFGSMGLETARVLNRFFRNRLNPIGLLPKIMPTVHYRWPIKGKIKSQSRIQAAANEIFYSVQEDNRQLDTQYQLGLAKYGYY